MNSKKELYSVIGTNIKRERERAGLTQERFSEMIGIGPKSLSAIERGTSGISLFTLFKMCETLSISSDRILFGSGSENDVAALAERFGRLTPEQYKIANDMLNNLLRAFALNDNTDQQQDTE